MVVKNVVVIYLKTDNVVQMESVGILVTLIVVMKMIIYVIVTREKIVVVFVVVQKK